MTLLIECALGVQAAFFELSKDNPKTGAEGQREVRQAQIKMLLCGFVISIYGPIFATHIIPMACVFPWLLLLFYIFGIRFVMGAPAELVNYLVADWKYQVQRRTWFCFLIALLGLLLGVRRR